MCRVRNVERVSTIVLCCVTLHNIQNKHHHGTYDYDRNLQDIANREPEQNIENDIEHIDENENLNGIQRQLQIIEFFNNQ